MIAIIDSGSTKADWCFLDAGKVIERLETTGLNPYFYDKDEMIAALNTYWQNTIDRQAVREIYFYGAGCKFEDRKAIVRESLRHYFPKAAIKVETDILGAARATAKKEKGIICILGTGMNSCYYDGMEIVDNLPSLGYVLGDEGSGSYLGKALLNAYAYRKLPRDLNLKFEERYGEDYQVFLTNIYHRPKPNAYLASFTVFLSDHLEHPFIQQLIVDAFDVFVQKCLMQYESIRKTPVHFVGSIGFYFKDILSEVLHGNGLEIGMVCQRPIDELLVYHTRGIMG